MKNQNILAPPYGDPLIHKLKKLSITFPSEILFCLALFP